MIRACWRWHRLQYPLTTRSEAMYTDPVSRAIILWISYTWNSGCRSFPKISDHATLYCRLTSWLWASDVLLYCKNYMAGLVIALVFVWLIIKTQERIICRGLVLVRCLLVGLKALKRIKKSYSILPPRLPLCSFLVPLEPSISLSSCLDIGKRRLSTIFNHWINCVNAAFST